MIDKPGFYPELSDTYHDAEHTPTRALSQTGIKTLINETPFDYMNPPPRGDTSAMNKGSVIHALALGKGKKFSISPFDAYTTKDARTWRDETIAEGLIPIKQDDYSDARIIADRMKARIDALLDGEAYETEVPAFWLEGDTWCRMMLDVWCPAMLTAIDLKGTKIIGKRAPAHMVNQGWDIQSAWYRRGLENLLPEFAGRVRFVNLLVRPEAPYTSRAVMLGEAWRQSAEAECERGLRIFRRCMASGEWPGYGDGIELLDGPSWTIKERIESGMMDDEDGSE